MIMIRNYFLSVTETDVTIFGYPYPDSKLHIHNMSVLKAGILLLCKQHATQSSVPSRSYMTSPALTARYTVTVFYSLYFNL